MVKFGKCCKLMVKFGKCYKLMVKFGKPCRFMQNLVNCCSLMVKLSKILQIYDKILLIEGKIWWNYCKFIACNDSYGIGCLVYLSNFWAILVKIVFLWTKVSKSDNFGKKFALIYKSKIW